MIHFVSELDFIESHLVAGDEVSLLVCNADFGACECNRYHSLPSCAKCIGRRQHGVSLLSKPIKMLPVAEALPVPQIIPKNLHSIDQLKSIAVDGFDIGEGIYSSLIDRCMSTQPDLLKERRAINTMARDSYRVWKTALSTLSSEKYDRVYIFNGRFCTTRAWVRACQRMGVPFYTHERSMKLGRIFLVEGAIPHDPTTYHRRITAFLDATKDNPSVLQEGVEFFEERPEGKNSAWKVFVGEQSKSELPEMWDPKRRNIVFFASTEREFVGVKQFTPPGIYDSQIDAILDLFPRAAALDPSIQFYLRVHPNSWREKIRWWENAAFTSISNLHIIPPESSVSTYELMRSCEKCLCFRSSMGIESTYWGKPSIALTWAFYAGLDAVYEPKTRQEALDLILAVLAPKPRENAIKFGSFLRRGGRALDHSTATSDLGKLLFKGTEPKAHPDIIERINKPFRIGRLARISAAVNRRMELLWWIRARVKFRNWFADAPLCRHARGFDPRPGQTL